MPGVIGVLTAKDIKGTNRLKLALADRPVLCDKKVRYIGDPVAVVAAETRSQALAAVKAVRVDYQPLPVLASPGEALAEGAVQVHDEWPNLCSVQPVIKGDAQKALAESANVIEARFTTQCVHQSPLEPETCLAFLEGEGEGRPIGDHRPQHPNPHPYRNDPGCPGLGESAVRRGLFRRGNSHQNRGDHRSHGRCGRAAF